jgi:hypothetical protein
MRIFLPALLVLLPFAALAQVPVKTTPGDSLKPKKTDLPVDTTEYWKDSLYLKGEPKIWRDGEVIRPPKPRPKRRKFKIRYSDRIQYPIALDYPMTALAGTPTVLSFQKKLTAWEDSILPRQFRGDTTLFEHRRSVLLRLGRMLLIDAPLETIVMAMESDPFGHYARMREFDLSGGSLKFGAPIPFWKPMNQFQFDMSVIGAQASRQQLAMVAAGGLETSQIASEMLGHRWMLRKNMFYRESLHFLRLQSAMAVSVFSASNDQANRSTAVDNWLYYGNRAYGFYSEYKYTASDLKRDYALATFTNPLLYISLNHVFRQYLFHGKDSIPMPAIKIGYGKTMMPWARYSFNPYGGEWIPELNFTKNRQMISLFARVGTGAFAQNYGGGVRLFNIRRSTELQLNAQIEYWYQRFLYLNWGNQETLPVGWGGAATVTGYYKVSKVWNHSMSIMLQAGYKTKGYMEGEMWKGTPIIRGGVSFNLDKDYEQDDTVPEYEEIPKRLSRKERIRAREKAKKAQRNKYKR